MPTYFLLAIKTQKIPLAFVPQWKIFWFRIVRVGEIINGIRQTWSKHPKPVQPSLLITAPQKNVQR